MKKILLITLLLIQVTVYGQNTPNWNVGVEVSTENLSLSDNRNGIDYLITDGSINGYAINFDKTNYSIGLRAKYFIRKNLSLTSGILYSNKDFSGKYNCATCDPIGKLFSKRTIEQRFLTIPISFEYVFLNGKLNPALEVGFKNNIELKNDLNKISNGYFLEAFASPSIYYTFSENWNFRIGYNYQMSLSDLYKTDNFNLRTNAFFLQINYIVK